MINKDKLDLLSLADKFKVTNRDGDEYKVDYYGDNNGYDLCAFISNDGIEYFVEGIYNSGCNYADIDVEALGELVRFCKMITKETEWKTQQ